ncbi:hypothetical protein JCM10212_006817 [Sporobolomyces blumeae]
MTALPSQTELKRLLERRAALQAELDAHRDLLERIAGVLDARSRGHGRMELAVELGPGFTAEGVVGDTARIIVNSGLEDLWLDLPIEGSQDFVKKRIALLERRLDDLEKPIKQMKQEYALVAKTLRDAFQLPDDDPTTTA